MALAITSCGNTSTKTLNSVTVNLLSANSINPGDLIVVEFAGDAGLLTVDYKYDGTNSDGGTWTQDLHATNTGNVDISINTKVASNANTASGTITVTTSAAQSTVVIVASVSGQADSSPADKSSSGTGSSTTPSSGATATLSQADEIGIGIIGIETASTNSAYDNSFTNLTVLATSGGGDASNIALEFGYKIVSSTAALTFSQTNSFNKDWAAGIVTYKAAAAATIFPDSWGPAVEQGYRSKHEVIPY